MEIYFLHHSGFIVDDGIRCYIFDAYKDPMHHIQEMANKGRKLWFFVSHFHADHFNPKIIKYDSPDTVYFIHKDVALKGVNKGKLHIMDVDDEIIEQGVNIHMYGSTDAGGSFMVDTAEGRVFHAGDLNWWHWLGDTDENNKEARKFFERELKRMDGEVMDIAFFPVDDRLEKVKDYGLIEWLNHVKVRKAIIAMHQNKEPGAKFWHLDENLLKKYAIKVWVPKFDGEKGIFNV